MKGQQITPWSIYNNNNNSSLIAEKCKIATERKSPEGKVVFPSIRNNTESKTMFLKKKKEVPITSRFSPKKLQAPPVEQPEESEEKSVQEQPEKQTGKIIKQLAISKDSLFNKNIEDMQKIDQNFKSYEKQVERKMILFLIKKTLTTESKKEVLRQTTQRKTSKYESLGNESSLGSSLESITRNNINSLPEVSNRRIHEGKHRMLDTGKIKMVLKQDTKESIAKRMQFLWKRTHSRNEQI